MVSWVRGREESTAEDGQLQSTFHVHVDQQRNELFTVTSKKAFLRSCSTPQDAPGIGFYIPFQPPINNKFVELDTSSARINLYSPTKHHRRHQKNGIHAINLETLMGFLQLKIYSTLLAQGRAPANSFHLKGFMHSAYASRGPDRAT